MLARICFINPHLSETAALVRYAAAKRVPSFGVVFCDSGHDDLSLPVFTRDQLVRARPAVHGVVGVVTETTESEVRFAASVCRPIQYAIVDDREDGYAFIDDFFLAAMS